MKKIKIPEHVFDYSNDDHNIQSATIKNVTMYIDDDENLLEKITGTIKVELKDGNVYKGKLIVGDEPGSVSIEMSGGMPVDDEEVLVELLQEDLMEASFEYENNDSQNAATTNTTSKIDEYGFEIKTFKIPDKTINPPKGGNHNISKVELKDIRMKTSRDTDPSIENAEETLEDVKGNIVVTLKDGKICTGKLKAGEEWGSVDFRINGMSVDDEEVLFELVNDALLTKDEDSDYEDVDASVKPSDMQRLLSQVILSNRKKILRAGFLDTVKDKAGKLKRSVGRGLKVKSSQMDWESYVEKQLADFCSAFVYDCYRYSILFDIYDDNMQEYGYEHATQKCLECVRDGYAEHIDSFLNKTSLKNSEEDEKEKAKSVIDEAYSKMIKKVKIDLYSDGIKFWKDLKDLEPNAAPNNLFGYESNGNFLAVLKKYLRPVEAYIGITRDSAGWKKRMEAFRE